MFWVVSEWLTLFCSLKKAVVIMNALHVHWLHLGTTILLGFVLAVDTMQQESSTQMVDMTDHFLPVISHDCRKWVGWVGSTLPTFHCFYLGGAYPTPAASSLMWFRSLPIWKLLLIATYTFFMLHIMSNYKYTGFNYHITLKITHLQKGLLKYSHCLYLNQSHHLDFS